MKELASSESGMADSEHRQRDVRHFGEIAEMRREVFAAFADEYTQR